ncbi:MAG: methyltransferase domain-containing protein [Bryobacterales bacterium]|nr:methyltransferase domain-containing protein [Bryobacterales bacterium]
MLFEWSGAAGAAALSERDVHVTTCPACGHHVAVLFYDGGKQPLATLGWPRTAGEARAMPKLPLRFVRCVDCGHVFNDAFDYTRVPYGDNPNLMYNRGLRWSDFLRKVCGEIISRLPENAVVVEIGHGDGTFLESLASLQPSGTFYGFDPHGATASRLGNVCYRRSLFVPAAQMAELRPDLLVSRHVLEHLTDPLGFVQSLSFGAAAEELKPVLYLEVPCIDRALTTGRTEDFYYEHNSHFTTESFSRMLARGFCSIDALDHGYDGEVVYAFLRLKGKREHLQHAHDAKAFDAMAQASRQVIMMELANHYMAGRTVAFWGGTGKCAAFLQAHHVDAHRFPLVVDSDPAKIGTFVPGTGQQILAIQTLKDKCVDILVVPTQWRARDIVEEAARSGIEFGQVVIPHQGRLVDFLTGDHPYQRPRLPNTACTAVLTPPSQRSEGLREALPA